MASSLPLLLALFLSLNSSPSASFALMARERLARPNHPSQELCLLENERSALYLSMPEDTPKGSLLTKLPIAGYSSGQRSNIRLSLVRGGEYIRLNPSSKELVLRRTIDREQGVARVEAVVECVPLLSAEEGYFALNISVFIAVTDVNDNPPKFPRGGQFSLNLPEELPRGTPIGLEFGATDRDQPGPNSHIRYRLLSSSPESGQDFSALLAIPDPFRPALFVAGRIDFETLQNFSVLIEAQDQGTPRLSSLAKLEVNVLDTDDISDLNPVFSSLIYTARGLRVGKGVNLAIEPSPIRAWDAEVAFNETILYALSGENSLNYAIDELTGSVRLLADRLVPAKLAITASQLNRAERNSTAFLLVEPLPEEAKMDQGNEGQQQPREIYIQKIPANLAIGTELFRLDSAGTGQMSKLELDEGSSPSSSHFLRLDRASGAVRLARKLAVGEYQADILVKPLSGRLSSSIRRIHLRLLVFEPADWGRHLPEFEQKKYEFEVDWNGLVVEGGGGDEGSEVDRGNGSSAEFIPIGQIRIVGHKWRGKQEREDGSGVGRAAEESGGERAEDEGEEARTGLASFSLLNGEGQFHIGLDSGLLSIRNPLFPSNASSNGQKRFGPSPPPPALIQLFVLAEDAEGRRNFVECVVRLLPSRGEQEEEEEGPGPGEFTGPWTVHLLALLCFLLLLSNCATASLWLGARRSRFDNSYGDLSGQYDSMGGREGCFWVGRKAVGNGNWTMNRGLEGDSSVKIAKTLVLPLPAHSSRDFFAMGGRM